MITFEATILEMTAFLEGCILGLIYVPDSNYFFKGLKIYLLDALNNFVLLNIVFSLTLKLFIISNLSAYFDMLKLSSLFSSLCEPQCHSNKHFG